MIKSLIFSATIAIFAGVTESTNCQPGLDYCGYNLLVRAPKNYYPYITASLRESSQPLDDTHIRFTLFRCIGTPDGDIEILNFCGEDSCVDGGTNRSDYCATAPSSSSSSSSSSLSSTPSALSSPLQTGSSVAEPTDSSGNNQDYIDKAIGISVGVSVFIAALVAAGIVFARRRQARKVIEMSELNQSGSISGIATPEISIEGAVTEMSAEGARAEMIGTGPAQGRPDWSASISELDPASQMCAELR
ncbi:hypothetical protein BS50DRAFT_390051 [Corynespora cassiicola Philippines]|uniref:Uncharacterized protein n=1 Tax=Corynespora cassiicola Philippines TaxID=1448308 RepID=A0A2T2NPL4_CORCC|nr:hypothetical protein BS50DRAFT_390051 [Corynespora cassiicola Philippines]